MPRPPSPPRRSDFSDTWELEQYDAVVRRSAQMAGTGENVDVDTYSVGGYYGTLLNSPPFAAAIQAMGTLVRSVGERGGGYSDADRELVDQVISADWGYDVVLPLHIPDALAVGVRLEAIEAIRSGNDQDLTEDERLLVTFIRQVESRTVTDEAWSQMVDRIGVRGAVEYLIWVAFLCLLLRTFNAFGYQAPPKAEIDQMLADFREGKRKPPVSLPPGGGGSGWGGRVQMGEGMNRKARPPVGPLRSEFTREDDLAAFDAMVAGALPPDADINTFRLPSIYGSIQNSPTFLAALYRMAGLARAAGERGDSFSHADREMVDLLVGFDWNYRGHFPTHIESAVAAGVRIECIEAMRHGTEENLTDDEKLVIEYIRKVVDRTVDDEAYDRMERRLGKRGAVEYTVWISRLCLILTLMAGFGYPSMPMDEVDATIEKIKAAGGQWEVEGTYNRTEMRKEADRLRARA